MPRRPRPRRPLTLTGQLLVFQFALLGLVLVSITVVSVHQSYTRFEAQQRQRMQTVAEYVAAIPLVRSSFSGPEASFDLIAPLESARTNSDVDQILALDAAGTVISSPADPRLYRTRAPLGAVGEGPQRAWTGPAQLLGQDVVAARVPVVDDTGKTVGSVVAARTVPDLGTMIASSGRDLLAFLGIATALGIAGAVWMAARVKRQTLGLEPIDIATLAEHREAMLRSIREGILAVDADGTITMANESARQLLDLPHAAQGRRLDDLGLSAQAVAILRGREPTPADMVIASGGRFLVLNQVTITPPGARSEIVTSLRDRTELLELRRTLEMSTSAANTLRAQAHEFRNRMHTISMLVQLGDGESAVAYIDALSRQHAETEALVAARIAVPAVSALFLAKASLARERDVELLLAEDSSLGPLDDEVAVDLVTVIGNLLDNALDAVIGAERRVVELGVRQLDEQGAPILSISVSDSGAGIDALTAPRIFEQGFTSKGAGAAAHGFGLSLVQLVVTRRGGSIRYLRTGTSRFEVVLPLTAARRPLSEVTT
ncbi:hypothetical protein C5C03_03350 [Clavibacter michiganensis]|uniref:sensor histidine kinase n=1 Tax=Clavibacter michiganensis TaxID=28447 RepID=UPI000CE80FC2|nr:ATP-binding protein [Clavibacter michiganensis]PPF89941.1 hypothetical protein C5C03_03350 [Clavibacter michiganensis]PPF97946.1 hypothetical protein C5C05_04440 [Clavibacter michiganensis]